METERGETLYQKMNAMFAEREEIFQKREAKLNNYRAELLALQQELSGQKEKLEAEYSKRAEQIEKEKKALTEEREDLARERAAMNQKREELRQEQEGIAVEMERIMLAKVELESLKNERLRIENEQETSLLQPSKEMMESLPKEAEKPVAPLATRGGGMSYKVLTETLAETLADQPGILLVDLKQELFSETPIEEPVRQEAPEESTPSEPEIEEVLEKPEQKEPKPMDSKEPAGLMERFVYKAKEIFPEGTALESTEELFCLSIGEKELRIMLQNPPAAVILARREKTKTLLKGISQLNRSQEEWEFSYQDNCLRATMPFTEVTPADLVLQKCADAMNRYFL